MLKKIFFSVVIVLILLVGGFTALVQSKSDFITKKFLSLIQENTGAPLLSDEPPSLRIFPVPGLELGASAWENGPLKITFEHALVEVSLSALLKGNVELTVASLEKPAILVNFQNVAQVKDKTKSTSNAGNDKELAPYELLARYLNPSMLSDLLRFCPTKFIIKDGLFEITDALGTRSFSHVELLLQDAYPDHDITLTASSLIDIHNRRIESTLSAVAYVSTDRVHADIKEFKINFVDDPLLSSTICAKMDYADNVLRVSSLDIAGANANLTGELAMVVPENSISGKIKLTDLNVTPFLESKPDNQAEPSQKNTVGTSNSAAPRKMSAVLPQINISVTAERLKVQQWEITDAATVLSGKNGVYTANPITLHILDDTVNMEGTLNLANPVPIMQAKLNAQDLNIERWLQQAGTAQAVSGKAQISASATAKLNNLLGTLSGKGLLSAKPFRLESNLLRLLPSGLGSSNADFSKANVPFIITNGIVNINGTELRSSSLLIRAGGTVNLPEQLLDLSGSVAILLKKITVPFGVTGSFSAPRISLSPANIIGGVTDVLKGGESVIDKGINTGLEFLLRKK